MKYFLALLLVLAQGAWAESAVGGVTVSATGNIFYISQSVATVASPLSAVVSTTISGTYTVDLSKGALFRLTLTNSSNTTLTFINPPPSNFTQGFMIMAIQGGSGSSTLIYPGSVDWSGGQPPTLSTSTTALDMLQFNSADQGTSYQGFLSGVDMR